MIAAHSFGMNPLFIWIGIGTGIAILSTLVVLIRFRQRQQKLPLPTIYLARHCKTAWNSEGRVQGTKDIELSPEGAHDAELNLPAIREFGHSANRLQYRETGYRKRQQSMPKGSAFPSSLRLDFASWIMANGKGNGLKIS